MGDILTKFGTTLELSWVMFERYGMMLELARLMLGEKFHAYVNNNY